MADLQIALDIIGRDLATKPLADVIHGLDGLQAQALTTNQAMMGVGAAMTAVGVAGAAGFGAVIGKASEFEHTMSGVKAVMTPDEVDRFGASLEALALQLGKDTVFSAKQAAEGLEELVKGGVSATDILDGAAAAALNLASAGGVPIKDAAEIAANAMNTFNLQGKDMAHVADLIAGAANASSLEVGDFKFALQQVGAVAKVSGQSLDDTAVAISILGAAGVKGSDAGTSLKVFLTDLVPKSKTAAEEMKKLGLITADGANQFFDAEGKARGFGEIAGILANAMAGLTEEEKLQSLHLIFGTDAMRAAAILADANTEGFDKMADAMSKVTAESVGMARMDNLSGSMEQLKGSLETIAITIGERFLPMARGLIDNLTAAANWFLELPEPVQNTAIAIAAVVTAVGLLGGPLLILIGALPAIVAGFGLLLPALAAVALPVAAITVAVGLLAAAWINDWGDIREHTADAIQFIQDGLNGWAVAFELAGQIPGIFARKVGDAFDALGTTVHDTLSAIGEFIGGAFDALGTTIQDAWQGYVDFINGTLDAIQSAVTTAWEAIPQDIRDSLAAIGENLSERWNGFVAFIGDRLSALGTLVHDTWQTVTDWIGARLSDIGAAINEKWTGFVGFIGEKAEAIRAVVADKWTALTTLTGEAWEAIRNTITEWLTGAAGALTVVTHWIGDVLSALGTFAHDALTKALEIGTSLVQGIQKGIGDAWEAFKGWFGDRVRDLLNGIKEQLGIHSPSQVAADEIGVPLGQGIIQGAASTIADGARVLLAQVTDLMNQAHQAIAGGGAAYVSGGLGLPNGMAGGLGAITATFGTGAGGSGTTQSTAPIGGSNTGNQFGIQEFMAGTGSAYPGSGLTAWRQNAPPLSPTGIYAHSAPGFGPIITEPTTTSMFGGGGGAAPTGPNPALWNAYANPPPGWTQDEWFAFLTNGSITPAGNPSLNSSADTAPVVINQTNNVYGTSPAEFQQAADTWLKRAQWQAGIA